MKTAEELEDRIADLLSMAKEEGHGIDPEAIETARKLQLAIGLTRLYAHDDGSLAADIDGPDGITVYLVFKGPHILRGLVTPNRHMRSRATSRSPHSVPVEPQA